MLIEKLGREEGVSVNNRECRSLTGRVQLEGKLVKFSIPFWLLRMKSGPIRIGSYANGWDDSRVRFTIEDLERHGPGLLIDETERTEGRVLVWVE